MIEKRKETVAGMFYEYDKNALQDQVKWCFTHAIGPGELPGGKKTDKHLLGIIVPHAGLPCSGPFAAHAYYSLATHDFPDVCILIGPNHSGNGPAVAIESKGEWDTPLGSLPIDEDICNQLTSSKIKMNPQILHQQENSLEVQLPFIKFLSNHLQKKCTLVPLVMNQQDLQTSEHIAEQIASILDKAERNISIIASSDFSHEGTSYGRFPPPGLTADAFARKQDEHALQSIKNKDPESLFQVIQQHQISMCGFGPVISLLSIAQKYKDSSVELLKYGTSHDTCSDSNTCVGYGALAVTQP